MIVEEIILGLVSLALGSGMLYYAKARYVPDVVKAFFSTWGIKSERLNRAISAVLGFCSLVSGVVFLVAGIVGWEIWPR
jgi:hypothetical protein